MVRHKLIEQEGIIVIRGEEEIVTYATALCGELEDEDDLREHWDQVTCQDCLNLRDKECE